MPTGLWALPRGHRPSRLSGTPGRSRVPELATPVIARAERWPDSLRSREQLLEAMDDLDGHRDPKERARRRLALRLLLDWLEGFDGDSWQLRWLASGADAAGRDWPALVNFRGVNRAYRVTQMTGASSRLILLDAIRPSYAWLFATIAGTLYERFLEVRDPAGFAALDAECGRMTPRFTPTDQRSAYVQLSRILIHTGGRLADINVDDCVEASRAQQQYQRKNHTHWYPLLRQAGILPETSPPSMLAATRRGQLSIAELVDAQHIQCRPVRDLFVDYLCERAPGLDYSSIVALVSKLIRLFWRDLEIHEPGIDSLNLPVEVARRWKQRLSVVRHGAGAGRPREDFAANLMAVRAFYADLTHWALEDPARWAVWVAPSPVTSRDLAGMGKQRQRAVARRHQRTRELSPVLPQLVARAEAQRRDANALLAAATCAEPGEVFESGGVRMRRLPPSRDGRPGVIFGLPDEPHVSRVNITLLEDYAFWAWASIEVLRHTAMRIREMLELTHRSFVAYTLPGTDEVIPLLQVAPSKTDRERLLVVSPELSEALAAIIARVRGGNDHIPLVSRYDGAERLHSPALPFLYQRPAGARQQPISAMFIKQLLDRVVSLDPIPAADGSPLRFTPHDFRRIFATDAAAAGLPVHILAKILGHESIATTQVYVAIYDHEVIEHHRGFIARRRSLRPSAEYREPTDAEWDDFIGHFALRKVELGTCGRAYGTRCQHEHACVRCPMLRPDPAQQARLVEITANLRDRLTEAHERGWHGEIEGLQVSLDGAEQKLATMRRSSPGPIRLGLPGTGPPPG
jgi:hypothetical protein